MKKRYYVYGILLLLLTGLAIWVFHQPDHLKELKKVEEVESGYEEPIAVVQEALEAVKKEDVKHLASLVLLRDSTEFERNIGPLLADPPFLPTRILGCSRLVHSSRKENIQIHIYSEPRDKTYLLAMLKDSAGNYKIYSVGSSNRRP